MTYPKAANTIKLPLWARMSPYLHLSGAVALGLASYLDRVGTWENAFGPLLAWGLITFALCPVSAAIVLVRMSLANWQQIVILVLTGAIELVQIIAFVPLIQ